MLSIDSRPTSLASGCPSVESASTSNSLTTPSLPSCSTSSPSSAFSATTVAAAAASVYGMTESRLTSLTSSPATTTYARLGSFYGSTTPYSADPTTTGSYMFGSTTSSFYPSLDSTGSNWTPGVLPHQTSCYPYDSSTLYNPYGDRYSGMDSAARRKNATRETTNTLKAWLYEHRKNPYPTKGEKIMLAIITKMTLTQVSTWFANARRRLKKENKMTWEPRNKTNDSCHDDDEGDDDKESLNGSEDNLSSSGGIGDNSTTTSILTPLGSASSGHHIHHHSMQANAGNGGSSGAVNQMNNSLHGTVQSHHQSHQQQYHLLQPLHHRTTASSSSSPPPSPRSLDKNDSLLMDGRTTTTSDNSCDKNLRNNNIKALNSQDRFAEHHHLNANHGHQPLQHHNTPLHHHNHHHHLPNPQLYHHPPHPGSEVMAGQYSNRSPTSFSSLLTPIHAMKHHPLQSNGSTNTSSSPTSLHTLQPTHHHPLSQYSAHMHGSPHQFLYHPQHHMRRSLTDDSSYDRPKIWSLAHVATDRLDG